MLYILSRPSGDLLVVEQGSPARRWVPVFSSIEKAGIFLSHQKESEAYLPILIEDSEIGDFCQAIMSEGLLLGVLDFDPSVPECQYPLVDFGALV